MVGRLVEQQHVRLLKQNLRKLDAHSPTARELIGRTVEVCSEETETRQRALNLSLIVIAAHHHVALMLLSEFLHKSHIRLRLIVGALCQLAVQFINLLL